MIVVPFVLVKPSNNLPYQTRLRVLQESYRRDGGGGSVILRQGFTSMLKTKFVDAHRPPRVSEVITKSEVCQYLLNMLQGIVKILLFSVCFFLVA
jgi:hypothetical protein